jgi:hypothetical protein
MRKATRAFLTGKAKAGRGMDDDELAAIRGFSKGNAASNGLRLSSNLLGGGGGIVAGAEGLTGLTTGNPALAVAPLVGMGLRKLYNNRTASAAEDIAEMLAQRSPLAQSLGSSPGIQNLLGAARAMHLTERVMRAARGPEGVWAGQ